MILVIYFDIFRKDLEKRLTQHNIPFQLVKYADLKEYKPTEPIKIIIVAGSKERILRTNDFPLLETYMKQDIHIIGICFGFQYLALKTGGKVVEGPLFKGTRTVNTICERTTTGKTNTEHLYFNHHDRVLDLPDKWTVVQRIDDFINIASTNKWIGFQFHPEKDDAAFRHYVLPFLHLCTF